MSEGIIVQALESVNLTNKSVSHITGTVSKTGNSLVVSVSVNVILSYSSVISNAS